MKKSEASFCEVLVSFSTFHFLASIITTRLVVDFCPLQSAGEFSMQGGKS
jgi:hypothetical protein